jgi:hypothetical protein
MRSAVLLACLLALGPQLASAQMSQGNGGARFAGVEGARNPSGQVMQRFVEASRTTLSGSIQLFKAIDQAQGADEAGAQVAGLAEEMTRQQAEEALATQVRVLSSLSKALAGGARVDTVHLNQALAVLAQALAQYDALLADLQELKAGMRKAQTSNNSPAMFIAKSLPGAAGELRRELRVVAEASRKSGAAVPEALLAN